jgi:hypothetical protein
VDCTLAQDADASPLFPPEAYELLREVMLHILSRSPYDYGFERSRWTLNSLLPILSAWLKVTSQAGLWGVLHRLDLSYRQGWEHMISPDPLAELKLAVLEAILARAQAHPGHVVVLWLDELTFYRLPNPAPAWSDSQAKRGPKAHLTSGSNTKARVGAVMNHHSGTVHYVLRSVCGVQQLIMLYQQIRLAYSEASEIYVIQDCWPTHFHPLVSQMACSLAITLVPLPTYSSWRNPIEKLWRWLKQDVLHMHPWAADWHHTKDQAARFLDRFCLPNTVLLRYCGLLD